MEHGVAARFAVLYVHVRLRRFENVIPQAHEGDFVPRFAPQRREDDVAPVAVAQTASFPQQLVYGFQVFALDGVHQGVQGGLWWNDDEMWGLNVVQVREMQQRRK